MKFCNIGGIRFSRIVMGSCYFGTKISERDSMEMMDYYMTQGGNVIDTAFSYANWLPDGAQASEKTIGRWLKSSGANAVIVTKAGLLERRDTADKKQSCAACLSYEQLRTEIEKSLDALGIPTVDAWLLHRDDENIPVDEIIDICNEFVHEGKTRLIGVSNWRPERIAAANAWAEKNGIVDGETNLSVACSVQTACDIVDKFLTVLETAGGVSFEDFDADDTAKENALSIGLVSSTTYTNNRNLTRYDLAAICYLLANLDVE